MEPLAAKARQLFSYVNLLFLVLLLHKQSQQASIEEQQLFGPLCAVALGQMRHHTKESTFNALNISNKD